MREKVGYVERVEVGERVGVFVGIKKVYYKFSLERESSMLCYRDFIVTVSWREVES